MLLALPHPQDLLQGAPFRQLVDELVEIADLAHRRFLDILDADAANGARDQLPERVQPVRLLEEGLEVGLLFQVRRQLGWRIAREPTDGRVDLRFRAPFLFRLGKVEGIDAGDAGGVDAMGLRGRHTRV